MDILVCIPGEKEDRIRSTKLNPISGKTDGYWTLSGCPKFTRRGDRIWFTIDREVVASAKIMDPRDRWDEEDGWEWDEEGWQPAIRFDIPSLIGHDFSIPHELSTGFRGFRYVRRTGKHVTSKHTRALELIGAKIARDLSPRNW